MAVAGHWGCQLGTSCYDLRYDVHPDRRIDVQDVMRVAAAWGTTCGSSDRALTANAERERGATLRLMPSRPTRYSRDSMDIDLVIDNVADLSGFQFALSYDPRVVRITQMQLGPALASTGRTAFALGPSQNESRLVFAGFSFGQAAGASGRSVVVRFTVEAQGTGKSRLHLSQVLLTNAGANPLRVGTVLDAGVLVRSQNITWMPQGGDDDDDHNDDDD